MTEIKTLIAAEEPLEKASFSGQLESSIPFRAGVFVFGANEKVGGACVFPVN